MLNDLAYFLNGVSLMFFLMAAIRVTVYALQGASRPHRLFAICLAWMVVIEAKEFFLSYDPAYQYEVLAPGYTFPDLFTLPLLSLFFFELVMPGRITGRYALRLLTPFLLLAGAYAAGSLCMPRTHYLSFGALLGDLPAFLPSVLLLYVLYAVGYCIFALVRIIGYSIRYAEQITQAYSFTERIHLRWMRWMSAVLAFYLVSYVGIIAFTCSPLYTNFIYAMSLCVWALLYGCIMEYRTPEIIRDYWQKQSAAPEPEESPTEQSGRIAVLRQQVAAAIGERRLYLDPGLTIVDLATECGTNRTHLSQFFNNELGMPFRDYINRCRIEHATRLMEQNSYKIEELAQLAGFGSTTTFYRAFAKEKGMTPQQWQETAYAQKIRGGDFDPADLGLRHGRPGRASGNETPPPSPVRECSRRPAIGKTGHKKTKRSKPLRSFADSTPRNRQWVPSGIRYQSSSSVSFRSIFDAIRSSVSRELSCTNRRFPKLVCLSLGLHDVQRG